LNPLSIIIRAAELINSPKKEMKLMTLITFLDFLAKMYLLAINEEIFIVAKLINPIHTV